ASDGERRNVLPFELTVEDDLTEAARAAVDHQMDQFAIEAGGRECRLVRDIIDAKNLGKVITAADVAERARHEIDGYAGLAQFGLDIAGPWLLEPGQTFLGGVEFQSAHGRRRRP